MKMRVVWRRMTRHQISNTAGFVVLNFGSKMVHRVDNTALVKCAEKDTSDETEHNVDSNSKEEPLLWPGPGRIGVSNSIIRLFMQDTRDVESPEPETAERKCDGRERMQETKFFVWNARVAKQCPEK